MKTGRPSKSVAEHKAAGTYRPNRHKDRAESRYTNAAPIKPRGCPRPDVWDLVVSVVPGDVISPIDGLELLELCRCHAMMDAAFENGDAKEYGQLVGRALAMWARFGCDPRSRPGIKSIGKPEVEDDPLQTLLKLRKDA